MNLLEIFERKWGRATLHRCGRNASARTVGAMPLLWAYRKDDFLHRTFIVDFLAYDPISLIYLSHFHFLYYLYTKGLPNYLCCCGDLIRNSP